MIDEEQQASKKEAGRRKGESAVFKNLQRRGEQ